MLLLKGALDDERAHPAQGPGLDGEANDIVDNDGLLSEVSAHRNHRKIFLGARFNSTLGNVIVARPEQQKGPRDHRILLRLTQRLFFRITGYGESALLFCARLEEAGYQGLLSFDPRRKLGIIIAQPGLIGGCISVNVHDAPWDLTPAIIFH